MSCKKNDEKLLAVSSLFKCDDYMYFNAQNNSTSQFHSLKGYPLVGNFLKLLALKMLNLTNYDNKRQIN